MQEKFCSASRIKRIKNEIKYILVQINAGTFASNIGIVWSFKFKFSQEMVIYRSLKATSIIFKLLLNLLRIIIFQFRKFETIHNCVVTTGIYCNSEK